MPNAILGFSPMSDDQWSELLELMRLGVESGMEYIWVDWCCVPQYIEDPMTEVMRSKVSWSCLYLRPMSLTPSFLQLFYARSAVMIAIPTYCLFADLPPTDVVILKNLLASASNVAGRRWLSADGLMTHAILNAIIEKERYASQEYFGR